MTDAPAGEFSGENSVTAVDFCAETAFSSSETDHFNLTKYIIA